MSHDPRAARGISQLTELAEEGTRISGSTGGGEHRNRTDYFMFLKSPPTKAARWMTFVGLYLSKMAMVCLRSLRAECGSQFSFPT